MVDRRATAITIRNGHHENRSERQSFSIATGRNYSAVWNDLMVAAGTDQLHPLTSSPMSPDVFSITGL